MKCIGDRKLEDGTIGNINDGCELLIGCVNDGTSEIRTLFEQCKDDKGLMELDRLKLQNIIKKCYNRPETLNDPKSLMSRLLKQLDIKWSKK